MNSITLSKNAGCNIEMSKVVKSKYFEQYPVETKTTLSGDINKEGKYYELVILNEHRRMVNMMIGLKDDRFVSCSFDKKIVVWSFNQATKEFKRDQVLLEHKMSVTGVCETKEGKMISVGQDKKMIVWRRIKCA